MRRCRRFASVLLFLVLALAGTSPSMAIPAFARKYRTSCQTCHIAFPALTPFGEAFRLNGYRFPAGTDAGVSKDEPVALGSEGYKKLWPQSVWPGEIPGSVPLSVVVESEVANDRASKTSSFDGLGGELGLLAGGTFGDHASFYSEVEVARDAGEIVTEMERLNVLFRPFNGPAFQFKIGAFEPGIFLFSNHRRLTDHRYFATDEKAGDNGWSAEPFQQGIEFFGVAAHRLLYNGGYVEGAGNAPNNAKDVYGRVAYKFGGLALDGTTKPGAESLAANPKPWSEKSLAVSAFVYKGSPLLSETRIVTTFTNDPNTNIVTQTDTDMSVSQDDRFTMYGGDIAWNFLNLMVRAGMSNRSDRRPLLSDPAATDISVKSRFGEVDWVAYPWLIPAARWESFDVAGVKQNRISLTVQFLVRANVRAFLAADQLKETGSNYKTEEVVAGIVYGM